MSLIDSFYKFTVSVEQSLGDRDYYSLNLNVAVKDNDILDRLSNPDSYIHLFNRSYCSLNGTDSYSIEFEDSESKLHLLRLVSWVEYDPFKGIVKTSEKTPHTMLFSTDHAGTFSIYAFNNLKERESELLDMFIAGDLDNQIAQFTADFPF